MKKVAIIQSNYIPWKGYFDVLNLVDEFILYDDVQYTRRDWRNRNRIKSAHGPLWLTIPVEVKGKYFQKIKDTVISEADWHRKHWQTLSHNYGRAPYFREYQTLFKDTYARCTSRFLSDVNREWITTLCQQLGIRTRITASMDYTLTAEEPTERLVEICRQAGATEYLSGPAAKAYMKEELFSQAGIRLSYMEYGSYPEYTQLYPPFDHFVSVLDLLLMTGPDATRYMKTFAPPAAPARAA